MENYYAVKSKEDFDIRIPELMKLAEKYYPTKKFKHALRVACYASDAAMKHKFLMPLEAFLVGLAHDLIEDTDCPQDFLQDILGPGLFNAVLILTKTDDETYNEYIQRVLNSEDEMAIHVKRADMKDHMTQLDTLTEKLKDKYIPVLHYFL